MLSLYFRSGFSSLSKRPNFTRLISRFNYSGSDGKEGRISPKASICKLQGECRSDLVCLSHPFPIPSLGAETDLEKQASARLSPYICCQALYSTWTNVIVGGLFYTKNPIFQGPRTPLSVIQIVQFMGK